MVLFDSEHRRLLELELRMLMITTAVFIRAKLLPNSCIS
jgi:hypothetical protein